MLAEILHRATALGANHHEVAVFQIGGHLDLGFVRRRRGSLHEA
jgi:hypothetical protein